MKEIEYTFKFEWDYNSGIDDLYLRNAWNNTLISKINEINGTAVNESTIIYANLEIMELV
jgi:hypothetical protein